MRIFFQHHGASDYVGVSTAVARSWVCGLQVFCWASDLRFDAFPVLVKELDECVSPVVDGVFLFFVRWGFFPPLSVRDHVLERLVGTHQDASAHACLVELGVIEPFKGCR